MEHWEKNSPEYLMKEKKLKRKAGGDIA